MNSNPYVMLIGGPDVDSRLDLMEHLKSTYTFTALGSNPSLKYSFETNHFKYINYDLHRGTNPIKDVVSLAKLITVIKNEKPDIVHTFDSKPGVWARYAAFLAGVPIIIGTLPGLGSLYSEDTKFQSRLVRLLYQNLQRLACAISDVTVFQNHDDCSQFIREKVVNREKARVVLGSGVSTQHFNPTLISQVQRESLKIELNIPSTHLVVTMVSRVIKSKGVLEFAQASEKVRERYPNTRFLLVGASDVESQDSLAEEELQFLEQNVQWIGKRNDIRKILSISDIFVLPSVLREGIPRVLLEAAAMQLPIITTNAPGCNEIVKNGLNGLYVPMRDVKALSEKITDLVSQPELRQEYGNTSRKRAVNLFDISIISSQIDSIYKNLLTDKSERIRAYS